jgi:hypothetical protein
MKRLPVLSIVLLVIAFFALSATRAAVAGNDWIKLGTISLADQVEAKEVRVTAVQGRFKALKFSAADADATVDQIMIELTSGKDLTQKVRDDIRKGTETRPVILDLKAGTPIRKLTVKGKSTEKGETTRLTVWARRD